MFFTTLGYIMIFVAGASCGLGIEDWMKGDGKAAGVNAAFTVASLTCAVVLLA